MMVVGQPVQSSLKCVNPPLDFILKFQAVAVKTAPNFKGLLFVASCMTFIILSSTQFIGLL